MLWRSPAIGLGSLAGCTAAGISICSRPPPLEVHMEPELPRADAAAVSLSEPQVLILIAAEMPSASCSAQAECTRICGFKAPGTGGRGVR